MSDPINIHEAKTHLSRLLDRVRRGATITIAKAGEPVAQLVPVGAAPRTGRQPVGDRAARLARLLETEVWPSVPAGELGRTLTHDEEDELLGYGPAGA